MKWIQLSFLSIALIIHSDAAAAFVSNQINHQSSYTYRRRGSVSVSTRSQSRNSSNDGDGDDLINMNTSRRTFLNKSLIPAAALSIAGWTDPNAIPKAEAVGLVKFPCTDYEFLNTYQFCRAGESLLEEEGIWSTNPLFLTNREAALSPKGIEQVERMCEELRADGVSPTVVRYSLAAAAIDSADIIGKELKVGRDRLVPEFNFMDPRAIGAWDMSHLDTTLDAVWAMDVDEGGRDGNGESARPPANEDGTPHENLANQVVRLQQLISVLETQYSGDTVLLVFPDGTGPALLTCLIGGIPLNRVHELEYRSGEVRLNVNYETSHAFLSREPSKEYSEAIVRGRGQLNGLRANPDKVFNVRDQQYAEEVRKDEEKKAELLAREVEAKKESDLAEKARLQQQQLQKMDGTATESSPVDSNALVVGGLTAVGAIGAASIFRGTDEESSVDAVESFQTSTDDQQELEGADTPTMQKINGIPDSFSTTAFNIGEIVSQASAKDDDDNAESSPTSDNASLPKSTKWDPDQDDGGMAWLGSLSEMMDEDEEDVDKVNGGSSTFE